MTRFLRLFHQFRILESSSRKNAITANDWRDEYLKVKATLEAVEHDEVELANVRNTVAELQHENDRLQARIYSAMEDRSRLWDALQAALASERAAYQLNINAATQRINGGIPYPDAPHLAQQAATQPGESTSLGRQGRISISDRLNQATESYIQAKIARS